MSYLAKQVSDYFETSHHSQRQIEEQAKLPRMTIGSIINGAKPRPERFGQLLRVIPDPIARDWLIAYIQDDLPEEWKDRVQIVIDSMNESHGTLREDPIPYGVPNTALAIQRLEAAIAKDVDLGAWLVRSVNLILGPAQPEETKLDMFESKTNAPSKTADSATRKRA